MQRLLGVASCSLFQQVGGASPIGYISYTGNLFAAEFVACHRKMQNCLFSAIFFLTQGFSGSFLILPFIKQ